MIPFWQLSHSRTAPAAVDCTTGRTATYGELAALADESAAALQVAAGSLVLLVARNDLPSLATYLGCLRMGLPVALLPPGAPVTAFLEAYTPEVVVGVDSISGYMAIAPKRWRRVAAATGPGANPALALLLSTSGSTGSPKLVRLSRDNLHANASAIADYLGLTPLERAPTSLPLSYSYGLSVVNSHLAAGATLLLGDFPVVQQETWHTLTRHGATSLAGVPLLYQLLRRLRFDPRTQPSLRTYTQAGGRLETETKQWFLERSTGTGARLFVMYGQTEATARIAFVPPASLPQKLDSIGRPIPGGELTVEPATGELIYRGSNVMLGYAEGRADLALGDTQRGVLRTGDLGRVDADGFFYVEGRLKRFIKLAGLRVSLDHLERELEARFGGAVACGGGDEALRVHTEATLPEVEIVTLLQREFGFAPSFVRVRTGSPLVRLPTGKIDYTALVHA